MEVCITGKSCILCSATLFMEGYRSQNCHGVLKPASLIAQLPMINDSFNSTWNAAMCRWLFLGFHTSIEYNFLGLLQQRNCSITLQYFVLKSFLFSLRSEAKCVLCGDISKSTTNETLLPATCKKCKCFELVLLQFIIHVFNWSILCYWCFSFLSCYDVRLAFIDTIRLQPKDIILSSKNQKFIKTAFDIWVDQ